jgi:hypothetical protein
VRVLTADLSTDPSTDYSTDLSTDENGLKAPIAPTMPWVDSSAGPGLVWDESGGFRFNNVAYGRYWSDWGGWRRVETVGDNAEYELCFVFVDELGVVLPDVEFPDQEPEEPAEPEDREMELSVEPEEEEPAEPEKAVEPEEPEEPVEPEEA